MQATTLRQDRTNDDVIATTMSCETIMFGSKIEINSSINEISGVLSHGSLLYMQKHLFMLADSIVSDAIENMKHLMRWSLMVKREESILSLSYRIIKKICLASKSNKAPRRCSEELGRKR
ncbi:hypothetical protein LOAG_10554 [Loa loa]|uniref:Uncharacterized protein n=1 Tax=Loa loa TaxID=7209 RepID=A0A1S0TPP7_LOALO|nr:hypothetical protein LOAG_10554 [Loa loa]EFO17943.1 hypothetical protein LOAG_10554 [Loa loa]